MISARCHCGNITLQFEKLTDTITQCNCSICRRLATKWAYFKTKDVQVSFKNQPSKTYQWGDKEILFHHCSACGCNTHYSGTTESGLDRIAINVNLLPIKMIENLSIRKFNGAEM